jgi:uncharacterized membrane protein
VQTPEFRRRLRQEANLWEQEGLIDQAVLTQLADRYQFDNLEDEASNRFVTILTGLGCVLIGLGVLSFVAANWQYLGKTWRIVLLLSAFVGINTTGYYLWRQTAVSRLGTNQRRFGESFLLLGSLLMGGNIALFAQMFNIGGEVGVLLMGWSIGVLIMAFSLRMASLGVFSLVVMGLGYWNLAFNNGALASMPAWTQILHSYMPIFAVGAFGLLAYRCKSLFVYVLASIAWLSSLQFTGVREMFNFSYNNRPTIDLIGFAIICGFPPLCLWATGRLQSLLPASPENFSRWSKRLAVISGGFTCFLLSLDYFMSSILWLGDNRQNISYVFRWQPVQLLFVAITIIFWILLWLRRSTLGWSKADISLLLLGTSITALVILIGSLNSKQIGMFAPGLFFVLLSAVTFGCIRAGLLTADRGAFYFGWLLLTVRIFTWFAFTQTDLMLKSLLFVFGGIATIVVGLWFERQLRHIHHSPNIL